MLIQITLGGLLYSNLFFKMSILSESNLYRTQWVISAFQHIVVMLLIRGYSLIIQKNLCICSLSGLQISSEHSGGPYFQIAKNQAMIIKVQVCLITQSRIYIIHYDLFIQEDVMIACSREINYGKLSAYCFIHI